jgi:hypothetical protein
MVPALVSFVTFITFVALVPVVAETSSLQKPDISHAQNVSNREDPGSQPGRESRKAEHKLVILTKLL